MTLQTEVPKQKATTTTTTTTTLENSSSHSDDNHSTTSSEDIALSPKRQNKKGTPPTPPEPQKKSTRNRQSALTNAFGNAIPINTITEGSGKTKEFYFEIDSPPEQPKSEYPSLKTFIQEMGFTDKTPQYQACLKFIEAISPKHGTKHTEVVDLTSPTDEHMADNNNETPLINENEKKQKIDDNDLQDDEEHNKQEEEPSKE